MVEKDGEKYLVVVCVLKGYNCIDIMITRTLHNLNMSEHAFWRLSVDL